LNKIKKELINKLSCGGKTKEIHEEKEAKQNKLNEIKQEIMKTSASYNNNRKNQILNQANIFLNAKDNFLTSRENAIKNLQNCSNIRDGVISYAKVVQVAKNDIGFNRDMVNLENKISKIKFADKHTKDFQNILVKYNEIGLLQMDKEYNSLMKIVQENNDLKVSLMIINILKLDSFDNNNYKIFRFATNYWEGTRTYLDSSMMAEVINSLKKNLEELKSELRQEEKEIKNLAED
jgi:hypothetical protein